MGAGSATINGTIPCAARTSAAIEQKDFAAFEPAFHAAVEMANAYHELKDKPYIRWKLPDTPPPDLDMTPRGGKK